jgi:hypothetical protein
MPAGWNQVDLSEWQRGLDTCLAIGRLEPSEFAERLGIAFSDTQDDLDLMKAALPRLESGKQYALVQHRGLVGRGTSILTNLFSRSLSADFEEVLAMFELSRGDLVAIHPELDGPGWVLWREDENGARLPMRVFALKQTAEFARAEYEAKGHKQSYWVAPAREAPPKGGPWIDPEHEFPHWEVWRGDATGARRRLNLVASRVRAGQLLKLYRSGEPEATFWTSPHQPGED